MTAEPRTFELPWPPSVNRYWRSTVVQRRRGGKRVPSIAVLLSEDGRRYRDDVVRRIRYGHRGAISPLSCALAVELVAHPPDRRRRDLDNLCKSVLDALEHANVYRDDAQIDDLRIVRAPVIRNGALLVTVRPLTVIGRTPDAAPPEAATLATESPA